MGFFNEKNVKFLIYCFMILVFIELLFTFLDKTFAYTNTVENTFKNSEIYYYINNQIQTKTGVNMDSYNYVRFYFQDKKIGGYRVVWFYSTNTNFNNYLGTYENLSSSGYNQFNLGFGNGVYVGMFTIYNNGDVDNYSKKTGTYSWDSAEMNSYLGLDYFPLNAYSYLYAEVKGATWGQAERFDSWNPYYAKLNNVVTTPYIEVDSNDIFVQNGYIVINPSSMILTNYNADVDLYVYTYDEDDSHSDYVIHTTLSYKNFEYSESDNTFKLPLAMFSSTLSYGFQYDFVIKVFTDYEYYSETILSVVWNENYYAGSGGSGGGGSTPSQPDYSDSLNDINDSLGELNDSINDTNDFLKDDSYNQQDIVDSMPSNNGVNDITEVPLDNLFNSLRDAFTSSTYKDIVIPLPFVNQSITIPSDFISSHIPSSVVSLIQLVYWFVISRFIFKDVNNYISKLKSGDITDSEESNIKADML